MLASGFCWFSWLWVSFGWGFGPGCGFRCRLAVGCCCAACVVGHAKLQLHFTGKHFLLQLFQRNSTPTPTPNPQIAQINSLWLAFGTISLRFDLLCLCCGFKLAFNWVRALNLINFPQIRSTLRLPVALGKFPVTTKSNQNHETSKKLAPENVVRKKFEICVEIITNWNCCSLPLFPIQLHSNYGFRIIQSAHLKDKF